MCARGRRAIVDCAPRPLALASAASRAEAMAALTGRNMDKRKLGKFGDRDRAADLRRQRVRLDGGRGDLVQAARRLRRGRLQLHRYRRRLFQMGAGPQGRRIRDHHRQVAEGARQPRQGGDRHQGRHGDARHRPGPAPRLHHGAGGGLRCKRLQTDYIDLYQSHSDDKETPLEETLGAYQRADRSRARCAPSAPRTTRRPRLAAGPEDQRRQQAAAL